MALLNRKTDYALLILTHLDQEAGGACARTIAERFHLSKAFVANILKELAQKNFVVSERGAKGGYVLARPAREMTLADLFAAFEEGFRLTSCCHATGEGEDCVAAKVCHLRDPMRELHRRLLEVFRGITLADLAKGTYPTLQRELELMGHG